MKASMAYQTLSTVKSDVRAAELKLSQWSVWKFEEKDGTLKPEILFLCAMCVGKQEEDKLQELTAKDKPDSRAVSKSIHQT